MDKASNYDLQVDVGRRLFLEYDQSRLIQKYALEADKEYIYFPYLNTQFRICRVSGQIDEGTETGWEECRSYSTVMTIYDFLCFHKGAAAPVLYGAFCTVGSFIVTGVQNTEPFTKKYAAAFDSRLDALKTACRKLGGTMEKAVAGADVTCRIPVTPFFPVVLQFWKGDDEFPPKLLLLWDKNTGHFLHFETTFYLQGDLLERLKKIMDM